MVHKKRMHEKEVNTQRTETVELAVLVSEMEYTVMLHAWLQSQVEVSANCPKYCTSLLMFSQFHNLADCLLWSFCLVIHVCMHDTNWVPVKGILWHLILRIFTKMCPNIRVLITVKLNTHLTFIICTLLSPSWVSVTNYLSQWKIFWSKGPTKN